MRLIPSLNNLSISDLSLVATTLTKFASGTATSASGSGPYPLTVTGLTFQPKVVVARYAGATISNTSISVYVDPAYASNARIYTSSNGYSYYNANITVTTNGFTLQVDSTSQAYNWIAYS